MVYDITGKKIYVKRIGKIKEVDNKNPHHRAALQYNHIRIQFPNGSEKSLLFTNKQMISAISRADKNKENIPKRNWITEFIPDLTDLADLQKLENVNKYSSALFVYNHIVVYINNQKTDLLFTDNDIKIALKRASKNPEDLPKVSWFTDFLD